MLIVFCVVILLYDLSAYPEVHTVIVVQWLHTIYTPVIVCTTVVSCAFYWSIYNAFSGFFCSFKLNYVLIPLHFTDNYSINLMTCQWINIMNEPFFDIFNNVIILSRYVGQYMGNYVYIINLHSQLCNFHISISSSFIKSSGYLVISSNIAISVFL